MHKIVAYRRQQLPVRTSRRWLGNSTCTDVVYIINISLKAYTVHQVLYTCWSIIQSIVQSVVQTTDQSPAFTINLADLGRQTHSAIPDDIKGTCPTLKTENCVCRTQRLYFAPWYTVLVNCPCNLRRRQVQLQWILYVVAICVSLPGISSFCSQRKTNNC